MTSETIVVSAKAGYGQPIDAWKDAAKSFFIRATESYTSVSVYIKPVGAAAFGVAHDASYHKDEGLWLATIPATECATAGLAVYRIEGLGLNDERQVLGEGYLRVRDGLAS